MFLRLRKLVTWLLEVGPNDACNGSWGFLLFITVALGLANLGAFGYAFIGLCYEAHDVGREIISTMIFAGLMTALGAFTTFCCLMEIIKKIMITFGRGGNNRPANNERDRVISSPEPPSLPGLQFAFA